MAETEGTIKSIAVNRKARHEYEILEKVETGVVLVGTEVKSVRQGHISLQEAYVVPQEGELWLEGCRINLYEHGNINNHDPMRSRKLLLHRREIDKLVKRVAEKGLTLIPLAAYFKERRLKIEVGLARGKKAYDKRQSIKEREVKQRIQRLTS
ncbi:MAG: SsrA-binding protein SmpB [Chlorobi bacterium]|nr:SsrA-binding protein SmpB [Chlorobiota bacterium]